MGLALLKSGANQCDVEVAWATYHAMVRAEISDPSLHNNAAHELACSIAKARFQRLFNDWVG